MSEPSIEVSGLRKTYGAALALDGMSFAVPAGWVTGLIGPNGAGKSTSMRVILGLDAPDQGHALVSGKPYRHLRQPLRQVGALLDADALAPARTARNHLLWLAHSQGMPARRVDEVIELVGLGAAARRKAGSFSLGMRQRLGIAAAMLGDPPSSCSTSPSTASTPRASSGCGTSYAPCPPRVASCSSPATSWPSFRASPTTWSSWDGQGDRRCRR